MMLHELIGMFVLLGLSAFFSGSETALFSLSRRELRQLEHAPGVVARTIVRLRQDPQSLLTAVLFGNMLVNVLYYSLATVAATSAASHGLHGVAYVLGIGSLVAVVICGEVMPKAIAVSRPLRFARFAAVPLFSFRAAIYPVRKVLGIFMNVSAAAARSGERTAYVTPEELQLLIRATGERGLIALTERDMMHEIVEFAEIRVREVMVPRVDVVAFEASGSKAEFCELVRQRAVNRVPVYQDRIDNVVGIVYARDAALSDSGGLRDFLRPIPLFVPETARIEAVLHQFRERKCQFAIVVDEYGGWAGIVTIEDIVEEIVGDIRDEFDARIEPVWKVGPDRYVLSGGVSIRDWSEIFGIDLDLAEVETLGGFIVLQLGRLPREGDRVMFGNLAFTVQKVHRRRAAEVLIERIGNGEGA